MRHLQKFENYEYQLNEGFVDNLKKMASIGLLTTSMLMGNSSIAQQYKKLDTKNKTEISNKVKENKDFRIGEIRMGMSIEQLKKVVDSSQVQIINSKWEKFTKYLLDEERDYLENYLENVGKNITHFIIKEYKINNQLFTNISLSFYKNKLFLIEINEKEIDRDIIKSQSIIHDIGKIYKGIVDCGFKYPFVTFCYLPVKKELDIEILKVKNKIDSEKKKLNISKRVSIFGE